MVERYSYKVDVLGSNPSRRTASKAVLLKAGDGRCNMKYQSLALLLLRVSLGWLFFYAGFSKFAGFSAKDYLLNLKGPFAGMFLPLAGNILVDQLVIWGLTLIGLCLILGILIRFASFWGIVMMVLFYLSEYPPAHAFLVDEHIIYISIFLFLMVSNAGHFYGFGKQLEKKFPKYKALIG